MEMHFLLMEPSGKTNVLFTFYGPVKLPLMLDILHLDGCWGLQAIIGNIPCYS